MSRALFHTFATILLVVGGTLACGGIMLIGAGGSWYYLLAGVAVLVSAIGLWRRARLGAAAFGLLLALTLPWALWESGLHGWPLMPRLVGPALVGLVYLLGARAIAAPRWWIAAPALASLAIVIAAFARDEMAESALPGAHPLPVAGSAAAWPHWGGDIGGTKHAAANQINTGNVGRLEVAWRYDNDIPPGKLVSLEAAPIAADGRLYVCVESGAMVALDQDTGRRIWQYRTFPTGSRFAGWKCRGAAHYTARAGGGECARRLFLTTAAGQLIALDADSGQRCRGFARDGIADLRVGMGGGADDALPTSPPTVVNGVIVVGQSISDFGSFDSPSGVIRGYDAETGALKWAWDAGRPGETLLKPGETYTRDTPNAWGVFSGDETLGLVYVGLGNSPPDYWAGRRTATADAFTDAIVALDVATGQLRWSFRTTNHDLWDYDIAAQSVAVDLPDGKPALIVPTKRGQLFVLDRRTGAPIDPVVQKPVPQGDPRINATAATQPYTTGFPSLSGEDLRESDMWGLTPLDQMACRIQFRRANYKGQFTPITREWTLTYPAVGGGINWGSVSVDRARGLLLVNTLHLANLNRLVPQDAAHPIKGGFEGGVIMFPQAGAPYSLAQFPFLSPVFAPCQQPPYSRLWALDLKTRRVVWSKPLGTAAGSGPLGLALGIPLRLGAPGFGGTLTTAGGLTFIAATQDRMLHAFDSANGRELWHARLPAVGAANPVSYVSPRTGRQYVVIAAGGHFAIPGPAASAIMAYAVPKP